MDFSETYVKMCEKATEIQEYLKTGFGLFTLHILPEAINVLTNWQNKFKGNYARHDLALDHSGNYWLIPPVIAQCIWLPRQDQLQEMLRSRTAGILRYPQLVVALSRWLEANDYLETIPAFAKFSEATSCPFFSMEQLWLAFVMKELYQKVWSGTEWTKKDGRQDDKKVLCAR